MRILHDFALQEDIETGIEKPRTEPQGSKE